MDQCPSALAGFEHDTVEVNGCSLASFVRNGHHESGGTPIIALHGWLDNAASFIPLFSELTLPSPCYLLDWPGHGASSHLPRGAQYHFVDWVEWLHRFILSKGFKRVHIVGHSLGALVGSLYAATFPEHVAKLVMIDGAGPFSAPEDTVVRNLHKAIKGRLKATEYNKAIYPSFAEAVEARLRSGGLSYTAAELLAQRGCKPVNGGWQWRYDPRLMCPSALRMTEEQVSTVIAHLHLPVLIILAKQGMPEMAQLLEKRKALFPHLDVEQLAGTHHLHMDEPAPCAQKIADFLLFA